MTKIAYLECPTGIAGDMCLGALVHAGVPLKYLIEKLGLLGITNEFRLWAELVHRNGQQATKVHVDLASGIQEGGETEGIPLAQSSLLEQSSQTVPHSHTATYSHTATHSHDPLHDRPHTHSVGHGLNGFPQTQSNSVFAGAGGCN